MLDRNIVVSQFEFQSRYYVHFLTNPRTKYETRLAMDYIALLLFFNDDGFGIK